MFISMPPSFPHDSFLEFTRQAGRYFPKVLSDEYLADPLQKCQQFTRALMAVCYRYRACAEHNQEFKHLLSQAGELWKEWGADEEQNYMVEQCLFQFFVNAWSVFESFGFCLYFLGNSVRPERFPHVAKPKEISLNEVTSEFTAAFPHASVTPALCRLRQAPEFKAISSVRNILAHRLTGRRNVRGYPTSNVGGALTFVKEEVWNIPGAEAELIFDEELIQRHLDDVSRLLASLVEASLDFVQNTKSMNSTQ